MKRYRITWSGTCYGETFVSAENKKEAEEKALNEDDDSDGSIEITDYPTDWNINEIEEDI